MNIIHNMLTSITFVGCHFNSKRIWADSTQDILPHCIVICHISSFTLYMIP